MLFHFHVLSRAAGVLKRPNFRCIVLFDKLTKMKGLEILGVILFFLPLLAFGSGDVYIVTVEGDPVVSYSGGIEGFSATAIDVMEEMDITR